MLRGVREALEPVWGPQIALRNKRSISGKPKIAGLRLCRKPRERVERGNAAWARPFHLSRASVTASSGLYRRAATAERDHNDGRGDKQRASATRMAGATAARTPGRMRGLRPCFRSGPLRRPILRAQLQRTSSPAKEIRVWRGTGGGWRPFRSPGPPNTGARADARPGAALGPTRGGRLIDIASLIG
jgi:hypothetical protein